MIRYIIWMIVLAPISVLDMMTLLYYDLGGRWTYFMYGGYDG